MSTNIVINGVLGRMGREIASIAEADEKIEIVGGLERLGHDLVGSDLGTVLGFGKKEISISDSAKNLAGENRIFIDFTVPESTIALIDSLKGSKSSVVIGTTGLTADQITKIDELAKTNAVLFSPNMSLGVNFLFYLTKLAAEKLGGDYDIEIIEAHHRFKKDSPSGTAKRLGEISAEAIGKTYEEAIKDGRSGIVGERTSDEIGMHAVRGGDIVGDHTVLFAGLGERIELRHQAHSRSTFAQGAVTAAKWLDGKEPGLYSMNDVLGI